MIVNVLTPNGYDLKRKRVEKEIYISFSSNNKERVGLFVYSFSHYCQQYFSHIGGHFT